MSCSNQAAKLMQPFQFKIKESSYLVCPKDSYNLNLVGFDSEVPILTFEANSKFKAVNKEHCEESQPKYQIIPFKSADSIPTLRGKKVIIKTNFTSGEKLLVFKQKTGGDVEIPAKFCNIVKSTSSTIENLNQPSKVPPPLAPLSEPVIPRHKPTILKRKGRLQYQIISDKNGVNGRDYLKDSTGSLPMENKTTTAEETNLPLVDHDYPTVRSSALTKENKDSLEVPVVESEVVLVNFIEADEPAPTKSEAAKLVKAYESFKPMPNNEVRNKSATIAEVTSKLKKNAPQYEVVNKKRRLLSEFDEPRPRSDHITTNVFSKQTVSVINTVETIKPTVKKVQVTDQSIQTSEPCQTRTIETNTDDSLLQDYINSRLREKAVQSPNPANIEFVSPSIEKLDQIGYVPPSDEPDSSLALISDTDLILSLYDFCPDSNLKNTPIIGQNANLGGKCISNFSNGGAPLIDISYSKGKYIGNEHWAVPMYNSNGNGKSQPDPWKIQFFLDLKHCHQFDNYGNIPLHVAVMKNNMKLVQRQCLALRIRNLSVDILNQNSLTALQLGLLHDANVTILQILINHRAEPMVLDAEGNTVLHLAVLHASDAVVQMLLGTCTTLAVDAPNFEGDTALILCVLHKQYVKADKILQAGANPNIGDRKSGRTPLFHAVEANDIEMVKLLLNYKAQTKVRNFFGTSPHDAMFELDSIDKTIRKLILNKDYVNYAGRTTGKEKKKKKDDDGSHTEKHVRPGHKGSKRKS